MNNTYRIEYTGDEVLKLLQKIDELTKSMGLEIIDSPDKATKPGIYAIEVEAIVFHSKYRQILLVSDYIEAAMGDYTLFQTLIDAESGSIKTRKYIDNVWTAWSTSGSFNIGDGTGTGALQQIFDGSKTLDFTGKNPALTADNVSTYFGTGADISKLPRGGVGNFATSLGGKSVAKGKRSTAEGTTTVAVGAYSHTEGDNTVALGSDSHAEGYETSAEGGASHSEGGGTHAKGNHSHTEGGLTKTTTGADYGHAEGLSTEVSGKYAHSEGSSTKAQGIASHSEGQETVASGDISHSEGYKTNATGNHAHSEGSNTIASADSAHSEGEGTEATSFRSHAEGSGTKTGALVDLSIPDPDEPSPPSTGGSSGEGGSGGGGGTSTPTISTGASHSEGYRTSAFGWGSHSEGGSTIAYNHYTHSEGERTKAYGEGSHSEGLATIAGNEADLTKGKGAHAEGYATKATGGHAHAEGYGTEATGTGSHSEGGNTTSSGEYAHSEGQGTVASGYASKAFGQATKATATRSVAGGYNAEANGDTSFSFGFNTKTTNEGEVAFGKYNKSNSNTLFSIGIGNADGDGRTNAFEVTTDGRVTIPLLQDHYTKAETYSKTEIDSKISSVYKYKGTVPSPMLLPLNKEIGDVYNTTFAGYIYSVSDDNFTLTGISSSDGEGISMNSEITLTFDKNISEVGKVTYVGTGADIAFWFDSSNFFIGKLISFSSNSIVVKIADLDITNTGYFMNPVLDSVQYIFSQFLSGVTTSIPIELIRYFAAIEFDFRYEYIPKGGNVAYSGDGGGNNGWDSLGSTIDTSNFATKNELNKKVNVSDVYTKSEVDDAISSVVDLHYDPDSTHAQSGKAVAEALSDYEKTQNKVTEITENATDEQYPSAKAVVGAIGKINNKLEYKIDKPTNRVYIGNVELGKWKKSNGNDYTSEPIAFCLTADVEPNSTYYASGIIVNSSFPLIVMFDSDNNVVGTKESQGNYTVKNDVEFVTPHNCTRVSINGRRITSSVEAAYPSLYYIANDNINGNTIVNSIDEKQNKIIEWKQADYEYVEDTFIVVNGSNKIVIKKNDVSKGYKYAKLRYDKNKKYRFFGQCNVSNIPLLIGCDENDEIIKVYDNTVGIVKAKEYDIADNVSYIYVQGTAMNPRVEVMEERNVTSFEANKVGVFFGDSITQGNNVYIHPSVIPYDDYPSVVGRLLNCTAYNGGLGGSTLSGSRSIDFKNVCDCVVSGDFSTVIEGITQYGLNQSAILQYNAISELDFNNVDFVTIAYGTNDWNFGKSIDNVKTSLNYCLDKLLTAYPHLKIYVFTPIYRFNLGDNNEDSDTYVNTTSGLKLHEICTAILEEAKTFNLPCKDMYYESNINKYTKTLYFNGTDGTHPNAKGYALMADKISKFINSN